MELELIEDSNHDELLVLLNPLVDFMIKHEYNYFIVAGKGGVCTRHLRGKADDVGGMIEGVMQTQKDFREVLTDIVREFKVRK